MPKLRLLLSTFLLLCSTVLFAQNKTIMGKVTNAKDGKSTGEVSVSLTYQKNLNNIYNFSVMASFENQE